MKTFELIELLHANARFQVRVRGSHRQFRHDDLPCTVTIAGKLGTDVPIGTLRSVLRQAKLAK
ncbi:type II toxin-antitoxin system HicA family toxin [Rugamonas rubra]|uniref:type II toxin-antitoxin system HicA family toxin n=1 Tax=Rugamonas rubra TaxID=758825 RepID=UPI000B82A285